MGIPQAGDWGRGIWVATGDADAGLVVAFAACSVSTTKSIRTAKGGPVATRRVAVQGSTGSAVLCAVRRNCQARRKISMHQRQLRLRRGGRRRKGDEGLQCSGVWSGRRQIRRGARLSGRGPLAGGG